MFMGGSSLLRKTLRIAAVLIVALTVIVAGLLFFLSSISLWIANAWLPGLLKTSVSIRDLDIRLLEGTVTMEMSWIRV